MQNLKLSISKKIITEGKDLRQKKKAARSEPPFEDTQKLSVRYMKLGFQRVLQHG